MAKITKFWPFLTKSWTTFGQVMTWYYWKMDFWAFWYQFHLPSSKIDRTGAFFVNSLKPSKKQDFSIFWELLRLNKNCSCELNFLTRRWGWYQNVQTTILEWYQVTSKKKAVHKLVKKGQNWVKSDKKVKMAQFDHYWQT